MTKIIAFTTDPDLRDEFERLLAEDLGMTKVEPGTPTSKCGAPTETLQFPSQFVPGKNVFIDAGIVTCLLCDRLLHIEMSIKAGVKHKDHWHPGDEIHKFTLGPDKGNGHAGH